MRKAIAYYRISTPLEESGKELLAQRVKANKIADVHKATIETEFIEYEKSLRFKRKEIITAVHYAIQIDALLIIAKLSSLERNTILLNFLHESRVHFIAADMPEFNTDTIAQLAEAAKKRSETASHKIKLALENVRATTRKGEEYKSVRTGRIIRRLGNPNGAAPLRKAGHGTKAALESIKKRADTKAYNLLPKIALLQAHGNMTLNALSEALNTEGVPSPRGGRWYPSSVRNLLLRTHLEHALQIKRPIRPHSQGSDTPYPQPLSKNTLENASDISPHELISRVGLDEARRLSETKFERSCIDAAATVLARGGDSDDLTYGTMLATIMPHKRIEDQKMDWRHETPEAIYTIAGGKGLNDSYFGVPFGSKARVILTFFFGKAVLGQNSIFEVGASRHDWVRALGYNKLGGATYTVLVEQAERLATCRLTVTPKNQGKLKARSYNFVREAHIMPEGQNTPPSADAVLLDEPEYIENYRHEPFVKVGVLPIYKDYKSEAFPIRWSAILAIGNNSAAIDTYLELSRTLPHLTKATLLNWEHIRQRSSAQYATGHDMRRGYLRSLKLAMAVYPQARVQILDEGILLHPSAPPIETPSSRKSDVDKQTRSSP